MEESVKENDLKPKRAKRRLYTTDISSPMEFSGQVVSDLHHMLFFLKGNNTNVTN